MNLVSKRLTAPAAALALVLLRAGPAALAAPAPENFAPLAEKVTPAVVNISSSITPTPACCPGLPSITPQGHRSRTSSASSAAATRSRAR